MLHEFLHENSMELVARCRSKVALRPAPPATPQEMEHGIPLFLQQLIRTLRMEQLPRDGSVAGRKAARDLPGEIGASATKHGHELLRNGFTVNQVVHDYGDLCQAVTELAAERGSAVSMDEFRTLNRCLDSAIADAVTEFDRQRDDLMAQRGTLAMSERLGSLAHEMRNFLNTATLGFAAIKTGRVAVQGATSAVVDRSLGGLRDLIDRTLADVRLVAGIEPHIEDFPLAAFIDDIRMSATLESEARRCEFTAVCDPPDLAVRADRQMLFSALSNVLQNAFKFTRPGTHVHLYAYGVGDRALIEVQDECGGLPEGGTEGLFQAFEQKALDRSGVGLGLSIARRAVEACGGTIRARDLPSLGCVFTIELPRRALRPRVSDRRAS
jgi:signal transduction histidine kinase